MQKDEDQLIKKMAKLLQEGATMLDKTCPKCNSLIYRLPNNKIICPSCNSQIVIQKEDSSIEKTLQDLPDSQVFKFEELLRTVLSKMKILNKKLQDEVDYGQMDKIITIINKLLSVYEKIYAIHRYSVET